MTHLVQCRNGNVYVFSIQNSENFRDVIHLTSTKIYVLTFSLLSRQAHYKIIDGSLVIQKIIIANRVMWS